MFPKIIDVTKITGCHVSTQVTAWSTPDGNRIVEHLAGRAPNGDLLVYYWVSGQDWRVVNVSQKTGHQVSGPVTSWTVPDGNRIVEHLAGRAPNGDLLVFYWVSGRDWRVVNVTNITKKKIGGPVRSWTTWNGNRIVEHVAGPSNISELLVFFWQPGQDWKVVDVTQITGILVEGEPVPYQINKDSIAEELLVVKGNNGSLYKMWWRPSLDWQAIDFKEAIGVEFATSPEVWTTTVQNKTVEHVAACDTSGHLIVSWFDSESRRLTDGLVNDFSHLSSHRGSHRRLVVILWDPQRPSDPAPSRAAVENAFVGNANSLRQFFNESSLGRFTFEVVDFLPPRGPGNPDWYPAQRPATHYWGPADPNDRDGDGFTSGHTEKWAEAVWAASADFDFSAYDHNKNGILDPNDLLVCMLIPQNGAAGFQRTPAGRQFPDWMPLKSDGVDSGVEIPTILEIYLGNPPHVGLMFHELAHLFLNAADMYHGWPPESEYVPFTAGPFSLMATGMPANLDPFHRMKYGWLRHRVTFRSGRYSLRPAATHGEALVLMDLNHSNKEYFLLENRWDVNNTCDANLPDRGLAVWHIIEDSAIYNASPTPTGTNPSYWNGIKNQWSRRGVRLIRPVVLPPNTINNQALWDGSDPDTGYDLLSVDPNPQHSELRWIGSSTAGSPSGFAIRNISPSGPTMTVDIEVPPRKGEILAAEGHVQMLRVHAHGTGYGPDSNRRHEDCVFKLDSKPGGSFFIDLSGINAPVGRRMFDLLRAVFQSKKLVRIDYEVTSALDGRTIRVNEIK